MEPESYLDSLEPIGWKLGLERMHRLCTALGMPQHRFASIHVVGTNGKSSVTRMTAALLEAHGLRTGASLSPHVSRWAERTMVGGREIDPGDFADAVGRVAEAAETVNRGLDEGEELTQFEVATAASFVALAAAGVEVAVVEAGLGGRLDATNTMPSRVTVLTSVGLDHTEWLGETELEIAGEKLAVLRDHTTLVVGRLGADALELARNTAAERGAALVEAGDDPGADVSLRAAGPFQRRNFAVALAAAEAFLGGPPDAGRVRKVAAELSIPGRLERVAEQPAAYLDAAHNPDGARALAEGIGEIGGPAVACLAILADKDAPAIVEALAPALRSVVCAELPADGSSPGGAGRAAGRRRSWPAAKLADICRGAGLEAEAEPDPEVAVARALSLAQDAGAPLVVAGSHYLLASARAALCHH